MAPTSLRFQISKMVIGQWTRHSEYSDRLVAECSFARKKLIWEIMDGEVPDTYDLKKKIEIEWEDVLSIRESTDSDDGSEILDVELRKPPTFYIESNPGARTQTRWKETDQDLTLDHQASICRRHRLHFLPEVLRENKEKLETGDSFWFKLFKRPFPTLSSLYFEQYCENSNNHRLTPNDPEDSKGRYPPLNLPLTLTPEFIKEIEIALQQDNNTWPRHQNLPPPTQNTETLKSPQTPTKLEKQKAISFQLSKITIGEWTHTQVYPDDVKGKFYFAKKKLMWEILDEVHTGTHVARLKRKIEIRWSDVLSFKATFHPHDGTETLEFELGKRPTFWMETNPQAGKHIKWKEMKEDFTLSQSASTFRRHTLHFFPGDLQKNLEKLLSGDSFWPKLAKVSFPTLPHSPLFDIGYGNSNNDDSSNLPPPYGHYQRLLSFNDDLLHQYYRHGELRGSQAYAQETQTGDMNEFALANFGAYLHGCLAQGEEIHPDANFQTNSIGHLGQRFSNNDGSLPPDL